MSQSRWARLEKGQFKIREIQCEKCINMMSNPMMCTKYPERKPNCVLKAECDCPKFEPKDK